ncbi:chromate resistance protein ChrB domain-containing protein [Dongia deserti]|uniref:chromate resistance protein ChrB domain-containing protein n=1 Tax=Dongia deserti TaxID=2268030 RepID=UPI0013C45EB2|nr:chromate resistance protein ChrB domain-containing protein [Dongia deserti]
MQWVTRQRPKIDRIACPWLITRFIDSDPTFLFVHVDEVIGVASATGAIPFDVPGVDLWHGGRGCSFDMLLAKYKLNDPALKRIAAIVREADNDNAPTIPEAAGLRAISLGLARGIRDDQARVSQGLMLYDALYRWAQNLEPVGRPERGIVLWLSQWRERRALAELDPYLLGDIGLSPHQVADECRKPFWRS